MGRGLPIYCVCLLRGALTLASITGYDLGPLARMITMGLLSIGA